MMKLRYLLFPPHSTSSPIVGMRNMNIREHRDGELILSFFQIGSQFSFRFIEGNHIEMKKEKVAKIVAFVVYQKPGSSKPENAD